MVTTIGVMGTIVDTALRAPSTMSECRTGLAPAAVRPSSASVTRESTPSATSCCRKAPMTLKVRTNTAPMMSTKSGSAVHLPVSRRSMRRLVSRSRLSRGLTTAAETMRSMNEKRMSAIAAARSSPRSCSIWETMRSTVSSSAWSRPRAEAVSSSPSTNFVAAKRTGTLARSAWSSTRCMIAWRQRWRAPSWSVGSQKSWRPGRSR